LFLLMIPSDAVGYKHSVTFSRSDMAKSG
jgi:hypothetical protein